jgi:L-fuculose-phosphate aldolase
MYNKDVMQELLSVCYRLDRKGFVGPSSGNVSAKCGDYIYITPTGTNKGLLTEEMIAIIDKDGKQVGGKLKATSELIMHYTCYYKMNVGRDIGGVVHTHAPYLTAFSISHTAVENLGYPELISNFDKIEVAPFGEPGTDAIIGEAIPYLRRNNVVMLGNHGALSVGKTVTEAMNAMETAEEIAKVVYLANTIGATVSLPDESIANARLQHTTKFRIV